MVKIAKQLVQNFLFSGSFYKGKIYLFFLCLVCVVFITCNFVKEPLGKTDDKVDGKADDKVDSKADVVIKDLTSACPDMDKSGGLLISELNEYWMELVNTADVSVCLGDYQFRAFSNYQLNLFSFNTNLVIAPQEYIVVRFEKGKKGNYEAPQTIFLDKVSLFGPREKGGGGFAELVLENRSSDFVRFCNSSGIDYLPLSGTFTGCLNFASAISITRNQQLTDSDNAKDWRSLPVPTYGGPNDVIDVTDNDRDGIPDANEMIGTTFVGMPVYEWGARAGQKDIFVHINYMEGFEKKPGLDPREDSLNKIKEVFLNNNFYIHFDTGTRHSAVVDPAKFNLSGEDHQVPYSEYTEILTTIKGYTPPITSKEIPTTITLREYKYKYFPNSRLQLFHYVLFANIASQRGEKRPNTAGVAETPGNDVILFLGTFGAGFTSKEIKKSKQLKNIIASSLFHELGHNLGLRHGGEDDLNYKPNHLSTMNYLYAYKGLPIQNNLNQNNFFNRYYNFFNPEKRKETINNIGTDSFIIDYSHGNIEDINEDMVQERNPLPTGGFGDIDWNFDLKITSNAYSNDVNKDNKKQVLKDYDEWENLSIPFDYNDSIYTRIPFSLDMRELDSHNSLGRVSDKHRFYNQDHLSPTIECEFIELKRDLERFKKTFYSNPDLGKD